MEARKTMLAVVIASTVAACGSDDNDESASQTYTLNGTVVDGYIYNALVWMDIDRDGEPDADEPQANTGLDGTYSFQISEAQKDALVGVPILAQLTNDSVDVGTEPPTTMEELEQKIAANEAEKVFEDAEDGHAIVLGMPPLTQADFDDLEDGELDGQVINPFTTQVHEELTSRVSAVLEDQNLDELSDEEIAALLVSLGSLVNQAIDDAVDELKEELEDSTLTDEELKDRLMGDFIAEGDTGEILELAESKVDERVSDERVAEELEDEYPDGKVTHYSYTDSYYGTPDNMDISLDFTVEGSETEIVDETANTLTYQATATEYYQRAGVKTVFSTFTEEAVQNLDDGTFTAKITFKADLNFDGEFDFTSHVYDVGVADEGETRGQWEFTRYVDESNPADSGGDSVTTDDPERELSYSTVDLFAEAVMAGDMSGVDLLQTMVEVEETTAEHDYESREFKEYDLDAAVPLEAATYAQVRERWDYVDGGNKEVIKHDWDADGSVNETTTSMNNADGSESYTKAGPVWNWDGSVSFEYQVNYWEEYTYTKGVNHDGQKIETSVGGKYILDEANAVKKVDENGDGMRFNRWNEVKTYWSETDIRTHVEWQHFEIEGYDYTFNDGGQKYSTLINDNYTGYPEYIGPYIEDLDELVDGWLEEGLSEQAIWLRVIGESIRGVSRSEGYDYCEVNATGESVNAALLATELTNCGGLQPLTEDDVVDSRLTRRKGNGVEVRFWDIYEGGMADRETWKADGNTENLGWDWSITSEGYLRLSKGDDFVRLIAPYFKGEYGAAVIIFDEYSDTSMNEMWSTYFVDTVDLYIPPQPE
ncbi:hypothetical protein [Vibrio owensii]|uniref:hypothetical protein n=1 Tax=Vibrio owensii TaxID=696485 RepID=UPI0005EFA68E|nr:hypothetical protein [Vibrio owensii]